MIKFDDEELQKEFNECHFRQEVGGVDICRCMTMPCGWTIEHGQCSMLTDYFSKRKEVGPHKERPQGKWIKHEDYNESCRYGCNQCGNLNNIPSNFCPNCGADMREEIEECSK